MAFSTLPILKKLTTNFNYEDCYYAFSIFNFNADFA